MSDLQYKQRPNISFWKQIDSDQSSLMGFVVPIVIWGGFIYAYYSNAGTAKAMDPLLFIIPLITSIIAWSFLYLRTKKVSAICDHGEVIQGTIEKVKFARKGKGYVRVNYEIGGEAHTYQESISKGKKTKNFKVGDPLTVWYLPDNPNKILIGELYE